MSKFKASSTTPGAPSGGGNVTNLKVKSIPNVVSWRGININNAFTVTRSMETDNFYGWGNSGNGIDTHMIKNTEWGAVVYLSKSVYGKNNEIWINPADNFTTGCAGDSVSSNPTTGCLRAYDTDNGQQASTTGNVYGVYDMSGTATYMAAYVNNGHNNLNLYGSNLINADAKYRNVYSVGTSDDREPNYVFTINHKGDAMYETSSYGSGTSSWYGDYSIMANQLFTWITRGGSYNEGGIAVAYHFFYSKGNGGNIRPVLLVGEGL